MLFHFQSGYTIIILTSEVQVIYLLHILASIGCSLYFFTSAFLSVYGHFIVVLIYVSLVNYAKHLFVFFSEMSISFAYFLVELF